MFGRSIDFKSVKHQETKSTIEDRIETSVFVANVLQKTIMTICNS